MCLLGEDHDESVKLREKEKVKNMRCIGQLYGVEKQQIANLNWAMEQLDGEDADCRCLAKEDPFSSSERMLDHAKEIKTGLELGSRMLTLLNHANSPMRQASDAWNVQYGGKEYNCEARITLID